MPATIVGFGPLANDQGSVRHAPNTAIEESELMDALSDVLRVVRLGGAVYLNGEFTAPWCLNGSPEAELCAAFLPPAQRVVSFHLITEGACWARLTDDPHSTLHVAAGEVLVVPQGEPHLMGSALDIPPTPTGPLLMSDFENRRGEVMTLVHGGGGTTTRVVCGFLACDESASNPILSTLPRIFKVDVRNDARSAWLESSLQFATAEAAESRAGSATVLARLSELLFVEAVRRCIDSLPNDHKGWMAGARDRFVGKALALLHARPAHPWTVDELARKVGLSRSSLAQRFAELLGQPPIQYLAQWRLQIAAQDLQVGQLTIATIAARVGYESEAAFSRTFKREFGQPPAEWRKNRETIRSADPAIRTIAQR